jgi:phage terminase large subunit-like protein
LYGYDPHNASQLIIDLQKSGLDIEKMTPVRQGWQLSTAAKEFERLSLSNSVLHGVNPIFNWMLSNVMIFKDNKENYILKKQDENAKIDGVISLLNALYLALESNLNNTDANEWFTPHPL